MGYSLCASFATSKPIIQPGILSANSTPRKVEWISNVTHNAKNTHFQSLEVKASKSSPGTKTNSLICPGCEGNGNVSCKQCKGSGVNSEDHFNGRFKAGGLCWLCRGKKEILCGSCNGAGFMGGILSSAED